MATKSLTFDIFGRDKTASKTLKGVGNSADRLGDQMRRAGRVMAVGLAVAGAAAVAFGIQSVKAFSEAQVAQERLNFAYAKFPKLADVNREAFDELNTALMLKTGFDDDALASGQAILAQFGLTGKQILKLTPLLLDYARANGKDLTTSAEDFGKALLGQGRALKAIGIDFEDTGTAAGNLDQLIQGLTSNVGGYAEEFGTTAAGKFEILTQKWGEFQEKVGEALLPGLVKMMEFADSDVMPKMEEFATWFGTEGVTHIKNFADFFKDNGPLIIGIGGATAAMLALNAATSANPIVLAVGGAIVALTWLSNNINRIMTDMDGLTSETVANAQSVGRFFNEAIVNMENGARAAVNGLIDVSNAIRAAFNFPPIPKLGYVNPQDANPNLYGDTTSGGRSGGRSSLTRSVDGAFADGGLVRGGRGGVVGLIGEGSRDELILPLPSRGMAGLGTTVIVNVSGFIGDEDRFIQKIQRATKNAGLRGAVA